MTSRTRRILLPLFFTLLIGTLLFFVVVRTDLPDTYRAVFTRASDAITDLGLPVSHLEVEAFSVVACFVTTTITAAALLYWALRELDVI